MNTINSSLQTWRTWSSWSTALIGLLALVGATLLSYFVTHGDIRVAITFTVSISLIALAAINIRLSILAAIVYLVFLGDLRRILIPMVGWSGQDPLLLIGPFFAIVLFGYAWASRSVKLDTPLAKWILLLTAIMALQIFNPRQGGLIIGVAGAMFYIIPLLWFWIGRTYASKPFSKALLFKLIPALAVIAALMGYYQTFYGYLPYQVQWYNIAGYTALGSMGIQAPISLFSSSTEYGVFLIMTIVVLWAVLIHKKNLPLLLLITALFIAVFLTGIRGPVAKLILTAAGLWAVLGRTKSSWLTRGAIAVTIGVIGLTWSLSQIGSVGGNARIEHRVNRQIEGLTSSLDRNSSSANHFYMMVRGLTHGFRTPLGEGIGATTKAAGKFGGSGHSSETDIGNVFISTGLVGGVVYLIVIFYVFLTALRYWSKTRSTLALALLGLITVSFLGWLQGGRYAVSPLIWLCIGSLDQLNQKPGQSSAA